MIFRQVCFGFRFKLGMLGCLQFAAIGAMLLGTAGAWGAEADGWNAQIKTAAEAETPALQPTTPAVINKSKREPAAAEAALEPAAAPAAPKVPALTEKKSTPGASDVVAPVAAEAVAAESTLNRENLAERYCNVAVDAAVAAKLKEEEAKANVLKAEIESRLDELKKATAELQKWLERREEFKAKATENLVTVYTQMDPEAAAQRLTLVGEPTAAAIIMKLPPKNASAVLGEMQADMAGKITAFMAGAAAVNTKSGGQAGGTQ